MEKFEIKAIRYCTGYTTDLRVKLPWKENEADSCYNRTITSFLFDNRRNIFGIFFYEKLGCTSDWTEGEKLTKEQVQNNEKIYDFLRKKAYQVCNAETNN